MFMNGQTITPK